MIVITIVIIGILLALGLIPKLSEQKILNEKETEIASASRSVKTVSVKPAPFEESATLPGNIGAMQYATIYSRVDGYLKNRMVDLGDQVKEGQVIAEIDTPTIDEELSQSLADLAQAKAELESARSNLKEAQAQSASANAQVKLHKADQEFASLTASRWQNMARDGAVSLQSRDEKLRALASQNASLEASAAEARAVDESVTAARARINVALASVASKQAAVQKLKAQQAFKYVRAPFDGVITLRKVDPGVLITAGSQSQNKELFQMAKLDVLRIYVNAPQKISKYLRPGTKAELFVAEFPERTFLGEVTNVAGALDPQTRSRQTEIRVENKDHVLLPGMYAQVKLTVRRNDAWVRVPSNAVIPWGDGLELVTVKDGKAHFQKVIIGRDFGDELEVKSGVSESEVVVINPPDDLLEGDPVSATAASNR